MKKATFISDVDAANLHSLIGKDTQIIYSDEYLLEFGEECIESKRFFISLKGDNYLELSLEWKDLEESLDSEYRFIITLAARSSRPSNHGCISLGSVSKISSIEIYSGESIDGVYYPQVIVLLREDGKKLTFLGGETAFRNIVFFINNNSLDDFLSQGNFSLRSKL